MSSSIVVYHKGCMDGVASAWAAWLLFPHWEYVAGRYQTDFDVERFRDKVVYMVDFSYPLKQMKDILSVCTKVVLLDHHKTCFDMLAELGPHPKLDSSRCNNEQSGCVITWNYFHNEAPPTLLLHIQDRDLWKFNFNNTRAILAACFSYDYENFEVFDGLVSEVNVLAAEGVTLLRDQSSRVRKAAAGAREVCGYWEVNALPDITSELGNFLCSVPLEDGSLPTHADVWFVSKGMINHSLRSVGDYDVSTLCKKFGGGGHKNAAGYKEAM